MPYTNVWSNTVLGSNPANTLDTLLTNIRLDLNERLTDLLTISSFVADPLVATALKLNRAANTKILGGTTNISIRNAADTLDNILVDNATGDVTVRGILTATSVIGSGASLTALNATNLTSGTVPNARFPAILPAVSGVNLTNLNASNLASGTIPDARLPASSAVLLTFKGTFTVRNAADTSNNLKVWDDGVVSTRGFPGAVLESGNLVIGNGGLAQEARLYMMDSVATVYKVLEMGTNILRIGHGAGGAPLQSIIVIPQNNFAQLPAAGMDGMIGLDINNGRFVYYTGNGRYYLAGTPF